MTPTSMMRGRTALANSGVALCALALSALVWPAPSLAQARHFDCSGQLKRENPFDGSPSDLLQRQWRITLNAEAGYVKRPPELAAGCLEKQVEICGCEQADNAVRCRSMGIATDGTEITMDFTLDRRTLVLRASGNRHHPKSGHLIETAGEFACEAAATP